MEKKSCTNCEIKNDITAKYCSGCGFELPKIANTTTNNTEPEKTGAQKKKLMPAIVGMVAFAISFFAVQHFVFSKPSFDKVMVEAASAINKTCPMMVDQDTRLDNTLALPDNIFVYNYTLVNIEKQAINIEEMKRFIEPNVINNMKTNPEMKPYRDNKTTLTYNYKDKNGAFILKIDVTPDKYE